MQRIASGVGCSETAFLVPDGPRVFSVRYFSPHIEVPFCGHATIAAAVAVAERVGAGQLVFNTAAGPIRVDAVWRASRFVATLTSRAPHLEDISANDLEPETPGIRVTGAAVRLQQV